MSTHSGFAVICLEIKDAMHAVLPRPLLSLLDLPSGLHIQGFLQDVLSVAVPRFSPHAKLG